MQLARRALHLSISNFPTDCCFVSDAVAYIIDEQSCLQDAEICMQQALSIDSTNSGAVAGLAECQDRLRICRQFNAQLS